jgi:transposase
MPNPKVDTAAVFKTTVVGSRLRRLRAPQLTFADCYCLDDGRPGIDPEVAVRLMLAGLLIGIVHDRKLMREAQVNIAIRWFIGYGLHEELPHHSSLTRIRQRWGEERFRRIFKRTVEACLQAKIATAEVVHIDASLICANVSWESLVERHVGDVLSENQIGEELEVERKGRQSGKYKKVCTTDPDATMATNARNRRLEPALSSTLPSMTKWASFWTS